MTNETINICGFAFHITWLVDKGIDQQGNVWIRDPEPRFEDPNKLGVILDAYNGIQKYMSEKN